MVSRTVRRASGAVRRGASTIGCLFWLLIFAAILYFGVNAFEVYYKYLEYKQAMDAEVRFRSMLADNTLLANLRAKADSLGLPEDAKKITIKREKGQISIEAHYDETIDLPGYKKEIHFEPKAKGSY